MNWSETFRKWTHTSHLCHVKQCHHRYQVSHSMQHSIIQLPYSRTVSSVSLNINDITYSTNESSKKYLRLLLIIWILNYSDTAVLWPYIVDFITFTRYIYSMDEIAYIVTTNFTMHIIRSLWIPLLFCWVFSIKLLYADLSFMNSQCIIMALWLKNLLVFL